MIAVWMCVAAAGGSFTNRGNREDGLSCGTPTANAKLCPGSFDIFSNGNASGNGGAKPGLAVFAGSSAAAAGQSGALVLAPCPYQVLLSVDCLEGNHPSLRWMQAADCLPVSIFSSFTVSPFIWAVLQATQQAHDGQSSSYQGSADKDITPARLPVAVLCCSPTWHVPGRCSPAC